MIKPRRVIINPTRACDSLKSKSSNSPTCSNASPKQFPVNGAANRSKINNAIKMGHFCKL